MASKKKKTRSRKFNPNAGEYVTIGGRRWYVLSVEQLPRSLSSGYRKRMTLEQQP